MDVSKKAFDAIKEALLSINPSGSELTVDVQNYFCFDSNGYRRECLFATDLVHDTGFPVILIYRDAEND